MNEINMNNIKFILHLYLVMFNSQEHSQMAYEEIQTVSPSFPHTDDKNFWNKLNTAFKEYCNMDIKELEEYLSQTPTESKILKRNRIFEYFRAKKENKLDIFNKNIEKSELKDIFFNYLLMLKAPHLVSSTYVELQKINPAFPSIDDEDFYNKLNSALIEYYNMDFEKVEAYLTETPEEADEMNRAKTFELIRSKKRII